MVPAVTEKGWVHDAPLKWRRAVLRPGFDPGASLVKELLGALSITEAGALDRLARDFRESDTALAGLVEERLAADEALLVVVDQLEEAFTLADAATLARLDAVLAEAVRAPRGRMYLVTTIRSDFAGRFGALPGLGPLLNAESEAGRYVLEPMSAPALREAIERPAERAGLVWEAGLVDRILEDASDTEGGLPLVAHVLRALWGERTGNVLGHGTYDVLGGVSGALTKSADGIVEGLGRVGRPGAADAAQAGEDRAGDGRCAADGESERGRCGGGRWGRRRAGAPGDVGRGAVQRGRRPGQGWSWWGRSGWIWFTRR